MVLDKRGDHWDRSCGRKKTYKPSFNEERNIVRPVERRKDNWIERQKGRKDEEEEDISSYFVTLRKRDNWTGHVLRRNCLLKYVIGGKIERREGKTKKKT